MGGIRPGGRRPVGPRPGAVVAVAVLLVAAAAGACGSGNTGAPPDRTSSPAAAPRDTASTTVRDNPDLPEGFPNQVVVVTGDPGSRTVELDVVDVDTGARRTLVDRATLARELGTTRPDEAMFTAPALTPDGAAVRVGFGSDRRSIVRVPLDGSAPPEQLVDLGEGGSWIYGESPDGRWRLVTDESGVLRLIPADGSPGPRTPGVPVAYGPSGVAWSPDGTLLAAVPHYERSAPPPPTAFTVDPLDGRLAGSDAPLPTIGPVQPGLRSGPPWFDANGRVHVLRGVVAPSGPPGSLVPLTFLAVDRSHRFALGLGVALPEDGTAPSVDEPARFMWWDAADEVPQPHPLDLDIDVADPYTGGMVPLVAW